MRSVQLVLQATHGVVSGEPEFFKAAFGATHEEFEDILSRPHHMIFNRQWYERYEGRGELDDYRAGFRRLSPSERVELLAFVSAHNPAQYEPNLRTLPANVRAVARAYVPLERERELEIRRIQRVRLENERSATVNLSAEEIVEDAGLEDEELASALPTRKTKTEKEGRVTTSSPLRERAPNVTRVDPDAVRVGKDVIEILTTGMYVSPVTIYREYIQNAADSIDAARAEGALGRGRRGAVSIAFDHAARAVTIRDNGAGIAASGRARHSSCYRRLGKARHKRARLSRRRAAFGPCLLPRRCNSGQRRPGESKITCVTWDCRALRERLADAAFGGDLRRAVANSVTLSEERTAGPRRAFLRGAPERYRAASQ